MAATAAAAVASSISTSMPSINCIRSKNWLSDSVLRIASTSTIMLQVASVSHTLGIESMSVSSKRRMPKIAASVSQEEAALMAPVEASPEEEEEVIQEEKGGEELSSEVEVADSTPPVNAKLYIGNLPYHVDSAQLAGIIQDYGSPELVEVLCDRESGKSRGFAFATMSTIEDCNAVIQNLDGVEYGGRTLRVNLADKPKPKEHSYPETEHKLFVGNLSWSVTSESLTHAFQKYGNVVGARVLYDGDTGRSRGYGFVCYATQAEMETALNTLNEAELEGRAIRVSLAQGKKQ